MAQYLILPIQLDLLYVPEGEYSVLDQKADFSILPYVDKEGRDVNSNTANISEMILSQPFENPNLRLGKGSHLHWALPDSLTRGEETPQGMVFPPVPNRWLVTRKREAKIEKQWVIESDYLFPEGLNKEGAAISIPYHQGNQAYRYMGRALSLSIWKEGSEGEYYQDLTALGYGEASFAAFYPNCFSVFGYYDDELQTLDPTITYEVLGWYSEPLKDPVTRLIKTLSNPTPEAIQNAVLEELEWQIPEGTTQIEASLYYGKIQVNKGFDLTMPKPQATPVITVANTPTEALSAHLAHRILAELTDVPEKDRPSTLRFIEDQLEAVQLSIALGKKQLDVLPRFRELRHEKGFRASAATVIWSIDKENPIPLTPDQAPQPLDATLPAALENALVELNQRQEEYDYQWHQIESMRQQLFADWYKYMISVYPPDRFSDDYPAPDQIKAFIDQFDIQPLQRLLQQTGELTVQELSNGDFQQLTIGNSAPNSLAATILQLVDQLVVMIGQTNASAQQEAQYRLKRGTGSRFWEPNEPVVMIEGDGVEVTQRHGQDGILKGLIFTATQSVTVNGFVAVLEFLAQAPTGFGLREFQKQPWNPFLLEWEAKFYPIQAGSNMRPKSGTYSTDYLRSNYEATIASHDLELKRGAGGLSQSPSVYSGECLLTSQANQLLEKRTEEYWKNQGLLERYQQEQGKSLLLPDEIDRFAAWYEAKEEKLPSIRVQIKAYQESRSLKCLSQSLGGFNEALLALKQTMEMALGDPLGFSMDGDNVDYKEFTEKLVAENIGQILLTSPAPLNDFYPIRTGALKLERLRIVDTFGQIKTINTDRIQTTYKMTSPGSSYLIKLPPRLQQPARLNFKWLPLDQSGPKKLEPPVICGWLLTNRLDRSLMVYDEEGRALGYFKAGKWHTAIDSDTAISLEEVESPHLKRVLDFVERAISEDENRENPDADTQFLSHFINTIDDALENIHPEVSSEYQGLSNLVGHPVALVRASLDLELLGKPAVNQSWESFWQDLRGTPRSTDGFTKVKVPVRLGEYDQLNDGLIGYWLEEKDIAGTTRFVPDLFYSPQSDYIDTSKIESQFDSPDKEDGPISFFQSIDDPPQFITILMDPRGSVHATVGLLPNRELHLSEGQCIQAINKMEVSFLNAPILTDQGRIQLPLGGDEGVHWSWVERVSNDPARKWTELHTYGEITKKGFIDVWESYKTNISGSDLWEYLLRPDVYWLEMTDTTLNKAKAISPEQRIKSQFEGVLKGTESRLDNLLTLYADRIEPAELNALFTGPKEIREGWLKIRKA